MRVLIVGAGGQLGTAVTQEFTRAGADVCPLTRRDLDVTDYMRVSRLARERPDAVINCAAYNAVDDAERQPEQATAVNAGAVGALAQMAHAVGAVFVHYSTDFVFDGEACRPYTEQDPPRPLGAYGRSKVLGEREAAAAPRHYVLRLASLFGGLPGEGMGGATTIDRLIDRTLAGQPVVAFSDRTVSPSYTYDVARATRLLLAGAVPSGIYHCVNTGWTTWMHLARALAAMLGAADCVHPVPMHTVTFAAPRPLWCALANDKLSNVGIRMPGWQDALVRHIAATRPLTQTVPVPADVTRRAGRAEGQV